MASGRARKFGLACFAAFPPPCRHLSQAFGGGAEAEAERGGGIVNGGGSGKEWFSAAKKLFFPTDAKKKIPRRREGLPLAT